MKKIKFIWFSLFVSGFAFFNGTVVWAQTTENLHTLDQIQDSVETLSSRNSLSALNDIPETIRNDINSVQSLMRLETMQMLGSADNRLLLQNKSKHGLHPQNLQNSAPDSNEYVIQPYIKSIYGVGNKLKAKISYKQRDYIYKKGQQHPIGIKPSINNVLLMTDFTDLCITLVGSSNTYDLCLNN